MLNFEQIKELIELVADRRLGGLEIERSGFRIRIEGGRSSCGQTVAEPQPADEALPGATTARGAEAADSAAISAAAEAAATGESAKPSSEAELPAGTHVMKSPIVGTFYQAPGPDSPPFVEVGAKVDHGEVLCIVEAMKLMNEIEADVGGTILRIYPQNGQPVEFGEPLFAIKPR